MNNFNETKQVYWVITGGIHEGQEAVFRAVVARLVESTKTEAGALAYEYSLTEDGRSFHIFERYIDSEAVKIHRANVGEILKELWAAATFKSFTLYGGASDELKELLAARHPIVMIPHNGFARG